MIIVDLYSPFSTQMRGWIIEQLVLERPHAEMAAEFIETYPGFGQVNGKVRPFEVLDKALRLLFKNIMRSKLGEKIRKRRRSSIQSDQMTLDSDDYCDNKRLELFDEMLEIERKFDNEDLSREEQIRLKNQMSMKKSVWERIDVYQRFKQREGNSGVLSSNRPDRELWWSQESLPELEFDDDETKPQLPKPKSQEPTEPEVIEPEWYEIDDSENFTM